MNSKEYLNLKKGVLDWLNSLRVDTTQYKMNRTADCTVFTSCFALFLMDLFTEVPSFSDSEKNSWIDYIRSFQDKHSGYFVPEKSVGASNIKTLPQLTSFCLSALAILEAEPTYDLHFTNRWRSAGDIDLYLRESGCYEGKPSSGNLAMFLAIFLTWNYENRHDQSALDKLEVWFRGHDQTQNPDTGFWGKSNKRDHYHQYQNAFHQFLIYKYWNRDINFSKRIIDNVLSLQDFEGHFGLLPGGSGCTDLDAADILIHLGLRKNYRCKEVVQLLQKLLTAILNDINPDSGFCESNKIPASRKELIRRRNMQFALSKFPSHLTTTRLKCLMMGPLVLSTPIQLQWTRRPRMVFESNLWDTWFRCLTIAEIDSAVHQNNQDRVTWNFQKFIGLGFYE